MKNQSGSFAESVQKVIFTQKKFYQMSGDRYYYIHKNPVEEGIVQYERDYLYSSAKDYSDEQGLVKISLL